MLSGPARADHRKNDSPGDVWRRHQKPTTLSTPELLVKPSQVCRMKKLLLLTLLVAGFVAFRGVGAYNQLVQLDESVSQSWSEVENVYQRRADLIPNLVQTVQGAADFERETLESVVQARASVGQVSLDHAPNAAELEQFQAAQGQLTSALSRLLVVVEDYPELRATEAFQDLQSQLEGTENRIAVARGRFTETVQQYNEVRRGFPTILFANVTGFAERPYFEAAPGAEQAPRVDFSRPN